MADPERLDPTLLPKRKRDKKPELDKLRNREMSMELFPERVVCNLGVPCDGAGIGQSDLLAFGELVGIRKV
jgi:hypothetical protein